MRNVSRHLGFLTATAVASCTPIASELPADAAQPPSAPIESTGPVSPHVEIGIDSGDLILNLWLTSLAEDTIVIEWSPCSLEPRGYLDDARESLAWVYEQKPSKASPDAECSTETRTDRVAPQESAKMTRYVGLTRSRYGWPRNSLRMWVAIELNGEMQEHPNRRR